MKDKITVIEDGNKTYYSCGCKMEVIGENLIVKPCSLDCVVFKYIIEESKKHGNIISHHVEKENR